MGQPGDGEALAAPRGMLDQVALTGARGLRFCHQAADGVELLVAGEDQVAGTSLAAPVVLLLYLVDELADQVEHAVARPRLLPQVGRGVARARGRHGRV